MKVLFVASGNSKNFDIAPFIKAQGESIKEQGIDIEYFPVLEKGLTGYIKSSFKLRKYLRENKFDLIHAHYTLCGWTVVLARPNTPVILSLMGSDAYGSYNGYKKVSYKSRYLTLLTYFIQPFLKGIISKSGNINKYVYRKRISYIIPNGVNLNQHEFNDIDFRTEFGLRNDKKYILFLGDKKDKRKNFALVKDAVELLDHSDIELLSPFPVPHHQVNKLLKSVNILVLTSFMEGSPNVIKEAMACNCPVVATDVGDVRWLFGDEPGYYVAGFLPEDFADKIKSALVFVKNTGRTKGADRIIKLGLDSCTVAEKLIEVYKKVV
ncbi:MAG: glycosyltransferase [Bacteroidales bacterium]|nr:glycosyltransferase [Bacteroidales bacterium]